MAVVVAISACEPMPPVLPKVNRVETVSTLVDVYFERGQDTLSKYDLAMLRSKINDISPPAVRSVVVMNGPGQTGLSQKRAYLARQLRMMGVDTRVIEYDTTETLRGQNMAMQFKYSVAAPPACPDWSQDAIANYDNLMHSNFGCATAINVGRQVADPMDLERGVGGQTFDSERNAVVLEQYRANRSFGSAVSSPQTTSGGGNSDSGQSTGESSQ